MVDLGDTEEMEVSSIETSGIEHSEDGDFAVPADNTTDWDDMTAPDEYQVPLSSRKPGMEYVMIRKNQIGTFLSRFRGARLLSKDDFSIPLEMQKEYGQPTSTVHEIYDCVYVELPKEVIQQREKQKIRNVRKSLSNIRSDEGLIQRTKDSGFEVKDNSKSSVADRMKRG